MRDIAGLEMRRQRNDVVAATGPVRSFPFQLLLRWVRYEASVVKGVDPTLVDEPLVSLKAPQPRDRWVVVVGVVQRRVCPAAQSIGEVEPITRIRHGAW